MKNSYAAVIAGLLFLLWPGNGFTAMQTITFDIEGMG